MKRKKTEDTRRERFESSYTPEPNSGCWLWLKQRNKYHYGAFLWCGHTTKRKNIGAHRAAWLLYRGEIPAGLYVLHKCDNTLCCNPDHLWVDTQKKNMEDMVAKGRTGKRGAPPKYTDDMVRAIRKAADQFGYKAAADLLKVPARTVYSFWTRERRGDLPD